MEIIAAEFCQKQRKNFRLWNVCFFHLLYTTAPSYSCANEVLITGFPGNVKLLRKHWSSDWMPNATQLGIISALAYWGEEDKSLVERY